MGAITKVYQLRAFMVLINQFIRRDGWNIKAMQFYFIPVLKDDGTDRI